MTSRQSCARAGCGAMATAFGCAESPAPGEPATRAKELAFTALRLKQLSRARNVRPARSARFARSRKPCWVADSPAAGAWASFAPQPAHAQLCSQQGGDPPVACLDVSCN